MSNGTTTTTVREYQAISPELKDYFIGFGEPGTEGFSPGLLGAAQKFYAQPYETTYKPYLESDVYGAGRVAPLPISPEQAGQAGRQFYSGIMGLQQPAAFGQAGQFAGQAAAGLQGIGGLQARDVSAPNLQTFQLAGPQMFGAEQAQQYMSPYTQAVTDVAKRKAMEDAQRSQLQANLGAGRRGALGSSGQILATTERERQLGTQLGDIQARGLQEAYTSAQAQFERDRAAQAQAAERNLAAQLGVQQLGATTSLEAQRANQQAQLEAARQRMAAAQGLGSLAQTTGQLGVLQQAADIDRLKLLGAYGDVERGLEQQRRDLEYQDVMRQVQYPEQRLMGMSSLLRGTPMGDRIGTTSATTPPPSFLSQLGGLGLTGLSLYNLLGRRD